MSIIFLVQQLIIFIKVNLQQKKKSNLLETYIYNWLRKKIKRAILKKPLKDRNFKGTIINHKRIERLMRKLEIRSKVCKKYKATTNSNHTLPVSENLLDRDFLAERPNQKLVSDITYVGTDEG